MSWEILRVGRVSSTQDTARAYAVSGAGVGTVIVADTQSEGRGRQGRAWDSPSGGLYMTALLEAGSHANLVPLVAGVAVAETMRDGFGVEAVLKWPNDVLIGGRKVGGVLVDAVWSGEERCVILLGVGVNLNNAIPELLDEATSLSEEAGEEIDVDAFLGSLLENLDGILSTLEGDPGEALSRWEGLSETLGKRIVIKGSSGDVFEGVAESIDHDGALKLNCGGRLIRVLSGTVLGR
jgi:BirA family biotin operon repressor/biotin-[acetyl-CoA-carboxylase] ligase